MKVKECMSEDVVWAKSDATVEDIAKQMNEQHVGCIPICDNNQLVGIITDRDVILRCLACNKDYKQTPANEIMTTKVYTVQPNDNVLEVIENMGEWQVKRVPVIENGELRGMITLGDLAKDSEISETTVGNIAKNICCGNRHQA